MIPFSNVQEILEEAVRQHRNVKGLDNRGEFHGKVVSLDQRHFTIRSLRSGESQILDLSSVQRISLNGGFSPLDE